MQVGCEMTLSGGSERASDMSSQTVLTAEDVDIDVVGEGDEEGMERGDSDCDSPDMLHDLRGETGDDDLEDEIEVDKEEIGSGGASPCCESSGEGETGRGEGQEQGAAAAGGIQKPKNSLVKPPYSYIALITMAILQSPLVPQRLLRENPAGTWQPGQRQLLDHGSSLGRHVRQWQLPQEEETVQESAA